MGGGVVLVPYISYSIFSMFEINGLVQITWIFIPITLMLISKIKCYIHYISAIKNDWKNLTGSSLTSYTWTGLSLKEGARYSYRVGAINHAGFLAAFETNGVVIDTSPPMVKSKSIFKNDLIKYEVKSSCLFS